MKSKLLVGFITFFVTIFLMIIGLNFFNSDSDKFYSFKRVFDSNQKILKFYIEKDKMNQSNNLMFINSNNFFVERDITFNDTINDSCRLYFEDFKFKNKKIINAILPTRSNLLFCNSKILIFTKHYNLFNYNLKTNITTNITFKNLKISCVKQIYNSESKFLCFGEYLIKNVYKTGFYIIDFATRKIELSKEIEINNDEKFLFNSLSYIGKFITFEKQNLISYYCDKYSKIFFFDLNGRYIKEFQTMDKTPLPKISTNSEGGTFYTQGSTWYSNKGIFFKDNFICVLSAATEDKLVITIDKYSYYKLNYIQSYKLKYNNLSALDITNLYFNNDEVFLCFNKNYAAFKIL